MDANLHGQFSEALHDVVDDRMPSTTHITVIAKLA
jgi:hypothetical protein